MPSRVYETFDGMQFKPNRGFIHRCLGHGLGVLIPVTDVEHWAVAVPLLDGDVVWCEDIVFRSGGRGRGRYAKFLHLRDDKTVTLYHRVSRNNIGSGNWEELNAMMTLALVDQIPRI